MLAKFIEIRDEGTCIPAVAFLMRPGDPVQERFFWRCGYPREGRPAVILMELNKQRATSDPYEWGGRTYPVAHNWLYEHFDDVANGQVVDVRVILGEAAEPASPEICVA